MPCTCSLNCGFVTCLFLCIKCLPTVLHYVYLSAYLCLSDRSHISRTTCLNVTTFSAYVASGLDGVYIVMSVIISKTRGKALSWEYRSPRKRNSRPPASVILCWVSWVENVLLIYYASSDLLVCLHWKKNPRFTAFLDSNLQTRLAIVTENGLGLAFPLGTFQKKFVQIRPRFI